MKTLQQFLQQSRAQAGAAGRFAARRAWSLFACGAVLALWPAADNRHALALPATQSAAPAVDPTAASRLDSMALGRSLLEAYQCGACHRIDGVSGAQGTQGPALLQWRQRSYIAGQLPNTPLALQAWIIDPSGLVPGTPMPAMGVTQHDARQMAAYLLRPE